MHQVLGTISAGGLACGFSSDGFGEHDYRWKRHGLPFKVFEYRSAFFPILPLDLVDDLLLQKRAFLISSTNPTLAAHPVVKPDIVGKSMHLCSVLISGITVLGFSRTDSV